MIVLQVIFWVLLILSLVGAFAPDTWPNINRGRWVVVLILLAVLGYAVFGGLR